MLIKIGILFVICGAGWAICFGNFFGLFLYSKRINDDVDKLMEKEKYFSSMNKSEVEDLRYYKLNRFLDIISVCLTLIGLIFIAISLV